MANDLREALEEIASESAPSNPAPDLWRRGKRQRRRQVAGGVVVAVGLFLASGGVVLGLDASRAAAPPVADVPDSALRLPDRVFNQSEWTKGAAVVGPIAVAYSASRGTWSGGEHGIMTISAVDGGYRFIDVPGLDRLEGLEGEWALSPGGTHIAWWAPAAGGGNLYRAVSALTVYDALTGEVVEQELPTVNGHLSDGGKLGWLDDDTLVYSVHQVTDVREDGFSGKLATARIWDVDSGAPRDTGLLSWSVQPPSLHTETRGKRWVVDPVSGERRPFAFISPRLQAVSVDPSMERFAAVDRRGVDPTSRTDNLALVWGDLPADAQVRPRARATGITGVSRIVGWSDPQHVVVLRDGSTRQPQLDLVDLSGGETTPYQTFDHYLGDSLQFAADLVTNPTRIGVEPPAAWDPRVPTVAGGLVLLVAGVWLVRRWRRSRWS